VSKVETVRGMFESYLAQDRDTADRLLADDFVFTSPQDDHIDKAAFFERCFPTVERLVSQEMLYVVPTEGDDVFVMYEYELKTGERHRNVEVLTVRDDRITETQVFFGGHVR
jgi:ketosteroid isomerase-like protein